MTIQQTIDTSKLVNAFKKGDESVQAALSNLFGADIFAPKVTDRIQTFEDACKDQGLKPKDVLPFSVKDLTAEQLAINAYAQLRVIAKSLQGGWFADFTNSNQQKWFPYFRLDAGGGFVLDGTSYDSTFTSSSVGSRLCFPNSEIAEYFGNQFIELHRLVLAN